MNKVRAAYKRLDYNNGDFLAHYQWRVMQDSVMPVWGLFQDDEDGMAVKFKNNDHCIVYMNKAFERPQGNKTKTVMIGSVKKYVPQGTEVVVLSATDPALVKIVEPRKHKDADGNFIDAGYTYSVDEEIYIGLNALMPITPVSIKYRVNKDVKNTSIESLPYSKDYLTKFSDERKFAVREFDKKCGDYYRLKDMSGAVNDKNSVGRWMKKDLLIDSDHYVVWCDAETYTYQGNVKTPKGTMTKGTEMLQFKDVNAKWINGKKYGKFKGICDDDESAIWMDMSKLLKIEVLDPPIVKTSKALGVGDYAYRLPYSPTRSGLIKYGEACSIIAQCGKYYWANKDVDGNRDCGEYYGTWADFTTFEEVDQNVRTALNEMRYYVDHYTQYAKEGGKLRTDQTDEATKCMDCTEFAMRFVAKVRGDEEVDTNNSDVFVSMMGKDVDGGGCGDYYCHIKGSGSKDFRDIKPGYIFLWSRGTLDGHVGVVEHVILNEKDPSKDIVIVLEAINGGSADETTCKNIAPIFETTYEKSGKVRRSFYYRTGGALSGHSGWKGYFKVKEKE